MPENPTIKAGQIYTDTGFLSFQIIRAVTDYTVYRQRVYSLLKQKYGPVLEMPLEVFTAGVERGLFEIQN